MGAVSYFGRKTTTDSAVGIAVVGNQRVSNMGSTTYNAWIYKFGARLGKPTSGSATGYCQWAIYKASSAASTGVITDFVGQTAGTVPVTGVMDYGGAGQTYTGVPSAPIKRYANQAYGLGIRSDGGSFNHGQDASGLKMHRNVGFAWPNPYNADSANPEGKMTIWTEEEINTAPALPSNVSPAEGGSVATGNPTLAADFRDDEEVLPGFALGTADKVSAFRFRILSVDKATVYKDSGKTAANGTMQTNRRATWLVPSTALASGAYLAQCTLWDDFDAFSVTKEWTFTVATSSIVVEPNPGDIAGTNPLVIFGGSPGYKITWDSDSGLAMANVEAKIVRRSDNAVVRGPNSAALSVADGASSTQVGAFATFGWASLPLGVEYRYEIRGQDTGGNWSGFAPGPWFRANAAPNTPSALDPPNAKAFVARPMLSAVYTDPDGTSEALIPAIFVRPSGDVSAGTSIGALSYQGNNRWGGVPSAGVVTGLGTWEWRTRSADAYEFSLYTAWQSFIMVTTPTLTVESPANLGTVTTGTPTLTATADRTVTSWRIRLYTPAGLLVADSGLVATSTISYAVPGSTLRNGVTYTQQTDVNTSDGLSTTFAKTWTLTYPLRAPLLNVVAENTPGEYEPVPAQYSEITVGPWDPAPANAPILLDAPLNGTLAATDRAGATTLTAIGPNLYRPAGRKNWFVNSRAAVDLTGWSGVTRVQDPAFITANNPSGWCFECTNPTVNLGGVRASQDWPAGVGCTIGMDVKWISGERASWYIWTSQSGVGTSGGLYSITAGDLDGALHRVVTSHANADNFVISTLNVTRGPGAPTGTSTIRFGNITVEEGVTAGTWIRENYWLENWGAMGSANAAPAVEAVAAEVVQGVTNLLPFGSMRAGTNNATPTDWGIQQGTGNNRDWGRHRYIEWNVTGITSPNPLFYAGPTGYAAVTAGNFYEASIWVMNTMAGSRSFNFGLTWFDSGFTVSSTDVASFTLAAGEARRLTYTPPACPAGRVWARLQLEETTNKAISDKFFLREAMVTAVASASGSSYTPRFNGSGTLLSGHGYAGTAHQSTATSSTTTLYAAAASHILTETGTILMRFFPYAGVSNANPFLLIGNTSVDAMQFRRNGAGSWDFGNRNASGWAETIWSESLDGAWHTLRVEWSGSGAFLRMQIDGGTWRSATTPKVWADLTLSNIRFGVGPEGLVSSGLVLDHILTDAEYTLLTTAMAADDLAYDGLLPYASDNTWGGYVVHRIDLETGEDEVVAHLLTRGETSWIDRRPISGKQYRYYVTYQYLVNSVDWIESDYTTDDAGVILENLVISDLADNGVSVPIRYWERRELENKADTEVVETFGPKPLTFQGILDYDIWTIDWEMIDDENGTYTARTQAEALKELGRAATDSAGRPVPKELYVRDPRGRGAFVTMTGFREDDPHLTMRASGRVTLTENATYETEE